MKRRQLIYLPQIDPFSFRLFFFRGESGKSYNLRHYPERGGIDILTAKDFPYTASEILAMAKYCYDATTHPTDDEEFWRDKIESLNKKHLSNKVDKKKSPSDSKRQKDLSSLKIKNWRHLQLYEPLPKIFTLKSKDGKVINSVDEWFKYAPPQQREKHWKNGRSAKELAKAFFQTGRLKVPNELESFFKCTPVLADFVPSLGIPEYTTSLDNFPGGKRNHDLIIIGYSNKIKVAIAIEAKADETFGKEIHEIKFKEGSNNLKRIEMLLRSLFDEIDNERAKRIRYQLLTGVTGALIEAKKQRADHAVFIVYEIISYALNQTKLSINDCDCERFVRELIKFKGPVFDPKKTYEKKSFPGGLFVPPDIPLLIGKVTSRI